ncbi:hypothetical protein ACIGJO_12315 [Streptomyces sp. NPDC079020]|uniref:hypothetical protein n=1 Tax=Streptomyces sp. NPDC079020 TaxID=3365722 RepID=UPI0037D94B02
MSDLFELQLALDLPDSLSSAELAILRWHLGGESDSDSETDGSGEAGEHPLLSSTGPARHIGGALTGVLCRGPGGWALLARQEVHPDEFEDLRLLLIWLAARTASTGAIGHLRFYETEIPDVLIAESGSVRRMVLAPTGTAGNPLLPD